MFIIKKEKIFVKDEVREIAKILRENEYDYALFGGEDFKLVYSVPKNNIKKIEGYIIGEITKDKTIKLKSHGEEKVIKEKGYDHFSNVV